MNVPVLHGHMARRVLLNYRVDAELLATLLPTPLRPLTWRRFGVAGICLIRLESVRPEGFPTWMGMASENAAHRVAVCWEEGGVTRTGVHVLRRDTSSWLTHRAGSRVFPGQFGRATFEIEGHEMGWDIRAKGPEMEVDLSLSLTATLPEGSLFRDMDEATAFFESGALGWSEGSRGLEGMSVEFEGWNLRPLKIHRAQASFFDDAQRFPAEKIALDSAFVMEHLPLRWRDAGMLEASCAC
jgi:hypothetical protein